MKKKIAKADPKPKTVSFEEGGDDVTFNHVMKDFTCVIGAMPHISREKRDACYMKASVHANTQTPVAFYVGSIFVEVPPASPKKDTVMPNFITPPRW